jgi:hypothetical protein
MPDRERHRLGLVNESTVNQMSSGEAGALCGVRGRKNQNESRDEI